MAISCQITVATVGTAVQGSDLGFGQFMVKAHPSNASGSIVYVGNVAGDVDNSNGYALQPGEVLIYAGHLTDLWFDASANGLKATVIKSAGYNEK